MEFLLQCENSKNLDLDVAILRSVLDRESFLHSYGWIDLELLRSFCINRGSRLTNVVPVGSLEFVQCFLSGVHGINVMNPIEVPEILRTEEFLGRKYSIVSKEGIPRCGYYFLKYVSKLKEFSYCGNLSFLGDTGYVLKEGLYQLSEVIDILSEYRCFVYKDELVGIKYYDGDVCVYPDIVAIKSMVNRFMLDSSRPKAYTIDVAILKNGSTVIIEVHPWVSVGLYSYIFNNLLPYCYRDGFDYYLSVNKELEKWSNF